MNNYRLNWTPLSPVTLTYYADDTNEDNQVALVGDDLIMVITLPTTLTKSAKKILAMMVLIITIILLTILTETAKAVLAVMVTIGTTGN